MYKQVCNFAVGAALAMFAAAADAATITRTFEFTAKNFHSDYIGGVPAPLDPVAASITLTFDDAVYVQDQTAGVTVNYLNLPISGPVGFTFSPGFGTGYFFLLGAVLGPFDRANSLALGTNDFFASWYFPLSDTPAGASLTYSQAGPANNWFSNELSIRSYAGPAAVPEPATWALMIMGLGAAGAALRRRRPSAEA